MIASATPSDGHIVKYNLSTGLNDDAGALITTGTGVATAAAINIGTVGSFVINGGALGTPSSGNLSGCSGYPTDTSRLPATGVGLVEKITATFDYRSAGTPVPVNSIAYVIDIPYAVSSINAWTVSCSASDTTGIIIDVFGVTHTLDTLPTATYCGTGTKPNVTNGHQTSATTPVTWNCQTTSFVAHTDLAFKVLTAPTTSQLCVITLTVTR